MKVIDQLKGISFILKIYSSPDVVIFLIDTNTILKGEEPHWIGHDVDSKRPKWELTWLDPRFQFRKNKRGRIKSTSINFGKEFAQGWTPVTQTSRYTTFVVFYQRKYLLASEHLKPVYLSK